MYTIQGILSGIVTMEFTNDSEKEAVKAAKALAKDPTFEGTCVRVLDIDGSLVYRKNFLNQKKA